MDPGVAGVPARLRLVGLGRLVLVGVGLLDLRRLGLFALLVLVALLGGLAGRSGIGQVGPPTGHHGPCGQGEDGKGDQEAAKAALE